MIDTAKRYLALAPRDFPYLRRLTVVEQGLDESTIELELCFCGASERCLIVRCTGVRDLAFRQPFTTDMKLHSLEVQDLASAQLEGISFEVHDLEQESLSFKCRTVEAEHRHA